MADHQDYLPGEAPTPHNTTHQAGGSDVVSVAGLAGETLELAAHKILPSIHHLKYTDAEAQAVADAQIATHAALATVHQDAPALIATHAALATVHQDAPALILAHKGDASAHHSKYTDAEAKAVSSPISINAVSFRPAIDTYDFSFWYNLGKNRTSLSAQYYLTSVFFPEGVTVTKLTLYAQRNDVLSALQLDLQRISNSGSLTTMASVVASWTSGISSGYDNSIASAVIDNATYSYTLMLKIDPNDNVNDVGFIRAMIDFTG